MVRKLYIPISFAVAILSWIILMLLDIHILSPVQSDLLRIPFSLVWLHALLSVPIFVGFQLEEEKRKKINKWLFVTAVAISFFAMILMIGVTALELIHHREAFPWVIIFMLVIHLSAIQCLAIIIGLTFLGCWIYSKKRDTSKPLRELFTSFLSRFIIPLYYTFLFIVSTFALFMTIAELFFPFIPI